MSPSEKKARALGVCPVRRDRTDKRNAQDKPVKLYVFERNGAGGRRVLNVEWHTVTGAWQAALRWARRTDRGEL